MRARIEQELALLRRYYSDVEHEEQGGDDWFKVPRYAFPVGWRIGKNAIDAAPIIFKTVSGYPTAQPYGFAAPAGINFKGAAPENPGSAVAPPFEGSWQHFSWSPADWTPTADARKGSNLLVWVRSFSERLREGA